MNDDLSINEENDETSWPPHALDEGRCILEQLDTLRADRGVVYLDIKRTKRLLRELLSLFKFYPGMHRRFHDRQPPLLSTLLWTGECFAVDDLANWKRLLGSDQGPQAYFQEQLELETSTEKLLPIHVACLVSQEDLVVEMANKRPDLLARQDSTGKLPFQKALQNSRHPPSYKVWKTLLHLYPQAHEHAFGGTPMKDRWDFISAFVNWFPKTQTSLVIDEYTTPAQDNNATAAAPRLTLDRTKDLCRLLPQLHTLSLNYKPGWDAEAFLYFLKELEGNHSLDEILDLTLPTSLPPEQKQPILTAFQQAFKRLKKLKLQSWETSAVNLSHLLPWLRTLQKGLHNSVWLKDLNFTVRVDGAVARSVVLEGSLPQTSCTNIKIHLMGFNPGDERVGHFLEEVAVLFSIHSLTVNDSVFTPLDLVHGTNPLAAVIKAIGQHLQKLKIRSCDVHIPTILRALKNNPQLRAFDYLGDREGKSKRTHDENICAFVDLLQHHNVTLTRCHHWYNQDPRIQYYLDLNRLGRQRVRTHSIDRSHLVQLLEAASNDYFDSLSTANRAKARHNAVYGLLREAPTLWCHAAPSISPPSVKEQIRKRKDPPL